MTNIKIVIKNPDPSSIAIEEESNEMASEDIDWTVER